MNGAASRPLSTGGDENFDGEWRCHNEALPVCKIMCNELRWSTAPKPWFIQIQLDEIWLPNDEGVTVQGKLSGGTIKWNDGDVWVRVDRPEVECVPAVAAAQHTRSTAAANWSEQRVLADWDGAAYGEGYLSLQKGELLSVSPDLEDNWAYGTSFLRAKTGWFPPSYAKQENCP